MAILTDEEREHAAQLIEQRSHTAKPELLKADTERFIAKCAEAHGVDVETIRAEIES